MVNKPLTKITKLQRLSEKVRHSCVFGVLALRKAGDYMPYVNVRGMQIARRLTLEFVETSNGSSQPRGFPSRALADAGMPQPGKKQR